VRKWDWFSPRTPPIKELIAASNIINFDVDRLYSMYDMIIRGASFCHVDKIKADIHEIEVMTDGYHIWHGAIPIFKVRAKVNKIKKDEVGWGLKENHIDILDIKRILEPTAWARKYFTAASVS
jgi:hypothetical protein